MNKSMAVESVNRAVDSGTRTFTRHRGPVTCVAGIPGRCAAVSSGYDSAVGIVDFTRGTIDLLGYHRHLVNRVVVNAAGTLAATCSSDYTICLWDLENRQPVRLLQGHWDDVEDFAFVDDKTGISASRDRRIFIWNLETGSVVRTLDGHTRDVLSVAYAGGKIYSSGDDMTLRQWDLEKGELLHSWGPFDVETDTCCIDPLHGRVVLGCDDGRIRIFDSRTGESVHRIDAHRSGIKKVAASPANGDILSAAYDQRILVWDAQSFDLKLELENRSGTWERSFNWQPDGRGILAGTFDGTMLRWEVDHGRLSDEVGGGSMPAGNACINDISANATGAAVTVSDDGIVRVAQLSAATAEWTQAVTPGSGRVLMNAVCFVDTTLPGTSEGLVLAGTHAQKLHVFRLLDGRLGAETELALGEGPINCIRIAQPGSAVTQAFVACYSGAVVHVLLDNAPAAVIEQKLSIHDGAVKALRIHPRDPLGVSCAADGSMSAWRFDGRIARHFTGHTAIVDDIDFDPSGRLLASVSRDFTVNVYDFASGLMRHSILLGRQSPKCVLFLDKSTIIVGNYWGDLWRVDLPQEVITTSRIAVNGISSVARCGNHVAAASYDGNVYLVDPADLSVVNRISAMRQKLRGFERAASFD